MSKIRNNKGQFTKKYNDFEEKENYYLGFDSNEKTFKISKKDYKKVCIHTWHINSRGYVKTTIGGHKGKKVFLHRYILQFKNPKIQVDHINHDKSDNRRKNLRICTNSQNSMNTKREKRGVYYRKDINKWRAVITVNQKRINLGHFSNYKNARKARKKAENKYFGEFSYKGN